MATYVVPPDHLSNVNPMDINFDEMMYSNMFDPNMADFFDPAVPSSQQILSSYLPPSDQFFDDRLKDDPSQYPPLPSDPHSHHSSRTHSPLGYDTNHLPQGWQNPNEAGSGIKDDAAVAVPSSAAAVFGFPSYPADMDAYAAMMQGDKPGFGVDPSLIHHNQLSTPLSLEQSSYINEQGLPSQPPSLSPSASIASSWAVSTSAAPQAVSVPDYSPRANGPPSAPLSRKHSAHSIHSRTSQSGSVTLDDDSKDRTVCPYTDCGKSFKDLKAHMLTHQNERPEKCPITSCEFHKRGFARKYDRNRHLVTTHYKATVVCGFCPGEGSSSERTFNRTDMFKRHLVAAHGVDQNNTSSKKRSRPSKQSPSSNVNASGKCTTCGNTFSNAQDLFDHLDDCILRVVTYTDPCESLNEKNLGSVVNDEDVHSTMKRHALPSYPSAQSTGSWDEEEEVSEHEEKENRPNKIRKSNSGDSLAIVHDTHVAKIGEQKSTRFSGPGLTYSKGGVDLAVGKGRRRRKHYPQSWGCSIEEMTLKKRVLCVFDGQRRLAKDDMMLGTEFQNRVELQEGGWVTDLDIKTLERAEAFHNATEEERGPWLPTNYPDSSIFPSPQKELTA